ncbi:MAG TPA: hypothetical protein VMZ26_18360, partial [Pyrinomonadaceae bacterium]|nr:hypothetical protein [Pyrinomonadaceae bacterium]
RAVTRDGKVADASWVAEIGVVIAEDEILRRKIVLYRPCLRPTETAPPSPNKRSLRPRKEESASCLVSDFRT